MFFSLHEQREIWHQTLSSVPELLWLMELRSGEKNICPVTNKLLGGQMWENQNDMRPPYVPLTQQGRTY